MIPIVPQNLLEVLSTSAIIENCLSNPYEPSLEKVCAFIDSVQPESLLDLLEIPELLEACDLYAEHPDMAPVCLFIDKIEEEAEE